MSSLPKQRLQQLSEQLAKPAEDPGTFEDIPRIRKIAGDPAGQQGKVVIITGANSPSGIGRASAHLFAGSGARAVFICDFADQYLQVHKRELGSLYPSVDIHARQFDASDESSIEQVVREALEKYGRLDVFFANAGINISQQRFYDASADDFMQTMKVNALSVFLAAKHASKAVLKTSDAKPYPSGSIIATASAAGMRSNAGPTDYSASKAAVISMMQTCAYQLAGTGIRCNAVCPGIIETGMTSKVYEMARSRGTERKIGQLNPLQRGGVADEIARVALFLGSDEASYVNGQAWAVCGGLTAGHPFVPGKLA
ncbi:hypothetical protein B0A49_06405 [Cryomyces minteri]|uniref:3-oxoacyl-[acyl-carrier-protein] reductase FabG n=1 Tax=Cryomyces minteri TaxID=331657 RepID=A0A4V5NH70_9PEZI|nr:hypothetical protein B0A49_06405 [Cryomyces minteri]